MRPTLLVAALLAISGCDVFPGSEPEYTRAPGELLIGDPSTPTIQVPSQIRPGVPVPISVTMQGGGCQQPGDTEVTFVEGAVEIRPLDLTLDGPSVACPAILIYYPHTVDVTPEAGPFLEPRGAAARLKERLGGAAGAWCNRIRAPRGAWPSFAVHPPAAQCARCFCFPPLPSPAAASTRPR